jgi:hypothetical protein
MANYRNRKLLDLAHRVETCQFNLAGCQRYSPYGCEPAHGNGSQFGKGTGIKAHDDQHCASCHHCHMVYDGHIKHDYSRQELTDKFIAARERTFKLYDACGWLDEVGYKP